MQTDMHALFNQQDSIQLGRKTPRPLFYEWGLSGNEKLNKPFKESIKSELTFF